MRTLQRFRPNEILKNRVKAIKNQLPPNYKSIIAERYPEYDSLAGADLIIRAISLRASDVRLTEILEKIAAEHQAELQEQTKAQAS